MSESASFARRIDALAEIVAFTAAAFERQGIAAALRTEVDFVIEELFTNMVKYNERGAGPITLELERAGGEVRVAIEDPDCEPFDITAAPEKDVTLPAEEREPGGLGLQLLRRFVDDIEYNHVARRTRIGFRRRLEKT